MIICTCLKTFTNSRIQNFGRGALRIFPLDGQIQGEVVVGTTPPIVRDVAMGGVTTKEQAIAHAQYLDLVYSQSSVLYDIIKDAPRPSIDPNQST